MLLHLAHLLALFLSKMSDTEPFFKIFSRYGFYFLRKHYYLPIPDDDDLKHLCNSELVGIAMNDEFQLSFTNDVILKYKSEFLSLPIH